jgi:hypothetical protein
MRNLLLYFLYFLSIISYSQNTYTPDKGSKERKEILDIIRKDYDQQTVFKVEHFKINGNWAALRVTPLKNNKDINDGFWSLLNKDSNRWKNVDWSKGIDFQDDFELIDLPTQNGRIAKLIVKKYPTCPMSIFGK